jgi:hypothetical protein
MNGMTPTRFAKSLAATLVVAGSLCAGVATASAGAEVIYNNLNTVATTVNAFPNEDTFSECFACNGHQSVGGEVELGGTDRTIKSLTAEVDSFLCENYAEGGAYNSEGCRSKPKKKFTEAMTVKVYAVTGTNQRGALLAESSTVAKIPYRPTTKLNCPDTGEGRGFGPNCDVGGALGIVKFKHFAYNVLPAHGDVIVELNTGARGEGVVNVGLEESYKEYKAGEPEPFIGELGTGMPSVGGQPLPEEIFANGDLRGPGYTGAQPVFEIVAKK